MPVKTRPRGIASYLGRVMGHLGRIMCIIATIPMLYIPKDESQTNVWHSFSLRTWCGHHHDPCWNSCLIAYLPHKSFLSFQLDRFCNDALRYGATLLYGCKLYLHSISMDFSPFRSLYLRYEALCCFLKSCYSFLELIDVQWSRRRAVLLSERSEYFERFGRSWHGGRSSFGTIAAPASNVCDTPGRDPLLVSLMSLMHT